MQLYQLKQLPAERGQGQLQFTPAGLADQPLRLLGPAAEALPVGVQQLRQLARAGQGQRVVGQLRVTKVESPNAINPSPS